MTRNVTLNEFADMSCFIEGAARLSLQYTHSFHTIFAEGCVKLGDEAIALTAQFETDGRVKRADGGTAVGKGDERGLGSEEITHGMSPDKS